MRHAGVRAGVRLPFRVAVNLIHIDDIIVVGVDDDVVLLPPWIEKRASLLGILAGEATFWILGIRSAAFLQKRQFSSG